MIRIYLYIIALLILMNVGVLLWPDSANYAPHAYNPKAEINPHFVRLNKEIEARFRVGMSDGVLASKVRPDVSVEESIVVQAASSDSAAECYRVGPFFHQPSYELAQAVLFKAGVEYRKSKRLSKESNVFRVFLGPFETSAQAADVRIDLKRQKVLDHFVRKQNDGFIVSLGIYSTAASTEAAIDLFEESLGVVNKQAESVLLPESYWLHFNVGEQEAVLATLVKISWGEVSAKMGKYSCEVVL